MDTPAVEIAKDPALKLNFLSHGTLESKDLEAAREFYTEFLGLEVVRTSPISLLIRLGGANTIAVVEQKNREEEMPMLNHNGLDVETQEEVDKAYETVIEQREKWGPAQDQQANFAARHLQLFLLGPRQQLLGNSDQSCRRL